MYLLLGGRYQEKHSQYFTGNCFRKRIFHCLTSRPWDSAYRVGWFSRLPSQNKISHWATDLRIARELGNVDMTKVWWIAFWCHTVFQPPSCISRKQGSWLTIGWKFTNWIRECLIKPQWGGRDSRVVGLSTVLTQISLAKGPEHDDHTPPTVDLDFHHSTYRPRHREFRLVIHMPFFIKTRWTHSICVARHVTHGWNWILILPWFGVCIQY